jgi:hypothetical protein
MRTSPRSAAPGLATASGDTGTGQPSNVTSPEALMADLERRLGRVLVPSNQRRASATVEKMRTSWPESSVSYSNMRTRP